MRDHLTTIGAAIDVVAISFTNRPEAARYIERHAPEVPLLLDPDRGVYRSYGLGRGSIRRVWSLRALRRYTQLVRRDGFDNLQPATDDTLQLGGDFVIDPAGLLRYGFWSEGPDDRPPADHLLATARSMLGQPG